VESPRYDQNAEYVDSEINSSQNMIAETSEFSWEDQIKTLKNTESGVKGNEFTQSYSELEEVKNQFETIDENMHAFMADISPAEVTSLLCTPCQELGLLYK